MTARKTSWRGERNDTKRKGRPTTAGDKKDKVVQEHKTRVAKTKEQQRHMAPTRGVGGKKHTQAGLNAKQKGSFLDRNPAPSKITRRDATNMPLQKAYMHPLQVSTNTLNTKYVLLLQAHEKGDTAQQPSTTNGPAPNSNTTETKNTDNTPQQQTAAAVKSSQHTHHTLQHVQSRAFGNHVSLRSWWSSVALAGG